MKWTLIVVLGLVVIGAGMFGVHQYSERQLSPAVRAAVAAYVGENVHESDIPEFLRAAKLASRTKRDAEVVALFDKTATLAATINREAKECDSIGLGSLIESASAKAYIGIGKGVMEQNPNGALDSLQNAREAMARAKVKEEQYNKCTETLGAKMKEARELIEKVRTAVK